MFSAGALTMPTAITSATCCSWRSRGASSRACGRRTLIARVGGDEFVLLARVGEPEVVTRRRSPTRCSPSFASRFRWPGVRCACRRASASGDVSRRRRRSARPAHQRRRGDVSREGARPQRLLFLRDLDERQRARAEVAARAGTCGSRLERNELIPQIPAEARGAPQVRCSAWRRARSAGRIRRSRGHHRARPVHSRLRKRPA